MSERLLSIYLNDQLAAGVLWREVRRAAKSNTGTPVGEALNDVATGIAEDVTTFEHIMERLGIRKNGVKSLLAVAAEQLDA